MAARNPEPNLNECFLCKSEEQDTLMLGQMHRTALFSVHEKCLYFSSGLAQEGDENGDNIVGFEIEDIKREEIRGSRLKCCYCKKMYATIGCVIARCPRSFHLGCGIKHGCLNQAIGPHSSYCDAHRPYQPDIGKLSIKAPCWICHEPIHEPERMTAVHAVCCKNGWFHFKCLMTYGANAGLHHFKCPLCNNVKLFQYEMLEYGIAIPDRDAAWEREPDAFEEMRPAIPVCCAEVCSVAGGRAFNNWHGGQQLYTCSGCGSAAIHKQCANLRMLDTDWMCDDCAPVEKKKNAPQTEEIPSHFNPIVKISADLYIAPSNALGEPSTANSTTVNSELNYKDVSLETNKDNLMDVTNSISEEPLALCDKYTEETSEEPSILCDNQTSGHCSSRNVGTKRMKLKQSKLMFSSKGLTHSNRFVDTVDENRPAVKSAVKRKQKTNKDCCCGQTNCIKEIFQSNSKHSKEKRKQKSKRKRDKLLHLS